MPLYSLAIQGGTAWPAVRIVAVSCLLYAVGNARATPDTQEITTSHVEIMRGLSLNYKEKGQNRDSRESTDCNSTESRTVNCNLECQCVDGKWQCCRLRKDINMMTKSEVKRFTDAFVKVANDPRYSPAFTSLSWSHAALSCTYLLRGPGGSSVKRDPLATFPGWHNMMIFALENLLRLVDCGVTVPYWDPTAKADSNITSTIPDGFGTFGLEKGNYCLTDGPFQKGLFKMPKLTYKGKPLPYPDCLQRAAAPVHVFPYQLFQTMLTTKPHLAAIFDDFIYHRFDKEFHEALRGSFLGLSIGVDPLFYLLHSYDIKIVANYQIQGPSYFTGGGRWYNDIPLTAFPWFKAKDFLDPFNLPNGVCVRYGASMPREKAIKMGYYAGLEIPRKDHLSLQYTDVRELPIDPIEAHTLSVFLGHMKKTFPSATFKEDGLWFNETAKSKPLYIDAFDYDQCKMVVKIYPGYLDFNVSMSLAQLV